MILFSVISFILVLYQLHLSDAQAIRCDNGQRVIAYGVDPHQERVIVDKHNMYRNMIMNGMVANQPRGTNLKQMVYDKLLGQKGYVVSKQCSMNHVQIHDDRWFAVGQNLYIEYSPYSDYTQNWDKAVEAWFMEHEDYSFGQDFSANTGHYTQVVWAKTNHVGCDFIMYEDYYYGYAKLYTCNYGPAGNMMGEKPYKTQ